MERRKREKRKVEREGWMKGGGRRWDRRWRKEVEWKVEGSGRMEGGGR